jgi:hypothetical protein
MRTTPLSQQAGDNNEIRKINNSIDIRAFLVKYIYQSNFIWYLVGVIVRILWTVIYPQRGYIHPVRRNILKKRNSSNSPFRMSFFKVQKSSLVCINKYDLKQF